MILRIIYSIFFICVFSQIKSQIIIQDQLWTDNQYRIIMYRDSTFSFSKIDEPMKDMIAGKWIARNDTFYLYSNDVIQLLLFGLYEQDSMHKLITHIDPRIYDSYRGVNIPKYFYLTKTYYNTGEVCNAYSFASCEENKKCFLDINHFNEKGQIIYRMYINLKTKKANYYEYTSNSFVIPKEKVIGQYKNGKAIGTWYYLEWNSNNTKIIKKTKERK